MNPIASRLSVFMGTASLFTIASVIAAQAQNQQVAQAAQAAPEALPEQVLITGSLIRGTAAVGVPVTSLGLQDFQTTGSVKIGDLFRNLPSIQIPTDADAINNGGHKTRLVGINIHGLDNNRAPRSLMMVDGVRFVLHDKNIMSLMVSTASSAVRTSVTS